jgi:hypothetical protein
VRRAVIHLFVAMLPALAAAQPAGQLIERTMAIVGGSAITLSDVRTAMTLRLVDGTDVNAATEQLVERALILREVERYAPPEPAAAQIDERVASIREAVGATDVAAALAAGGFTDARLRGWLRDDLRIASYIDQRFASDGPERRAALVADWISDLRRRTPVVELWRQ